MKIGVALKALRATLTEPILLFGIPFDFVLFALTLLGIALFHRHTLPIARAFLVPPKISRSTAALSGFE
jgi:hypothetical protein